MTENNNCTGHATYPDIISLPVTNSITLRQFLEFVSREEFSGEGATLDLRGDRTFVESVSCKSCGVRIRLNKPNFRIFDTETICRNCTSKDSGLYDENQSESLSTKLTIPEFSLRQSPEDLLDVSLWDLGIPHRHVVAVYDKVAKYKYYELALDDPFIQI